MKIDESTFLSTSLHFYHRSLSLPAKKASTNSIFIYKFLQAFYNILHFFATFHPYLYEFSHIFLKSFSKNTNVFRNTNIFFYILSCININSKTRNYVFGYLSEERVVKAKSGIDIYKNFLCYKRLLRILMFLGIYQRTRGEVCKSIKKKKNVKLIVQITLHQYYKEQFEHFLKNLKIQVVVLASLKIV